MMAPLLPISQPYPAEDYGELTPWRLCSVYIFYNDECEEACTVGSTCSRLDRLVEQGMVVQA